MTYTELLYKYNEFLWSTFQYDVSVFSQEWMYYCLLIPALSYLCFFMLKWCILLLPFYAPILIPLKAYVYVNYIKHNSDKK